MGAFDWLALFFACMIVGFQVVGELCVRDHRTVQWQC
jgi:hypothetical protein